MSIEFVMPSYCFVFCRPLLLPEVFPRIKVLSNEWALSIQWPKCWSFSISPSNEYSGLISFRIDWFDHIGYIFKKCWVNIHFFPLSLVLPRRKKAIAIPTTSCGESQDLGDRNGLKNQNLNNKLSNLGYCLISPNYEM